MPGLFAEIKEKEDYFHFIACLSSVLLIGCFTEITRGPDSISSDKTIEQSENTGPDSRLYTIQRSGVSAIGKKYDLHSTLLSNKTQCTVNDAWA